MHLELAFIYLSSSITVFFHSQWYLAIAYLFIIPIIFKSPLLSLQLLCGHPLFLVPFILTVEIILTFFGFALSSPYTC